MDRGLGRADDLFPFDDLVGFRDGNGFIHEIKIIISQCKKLAFSNPCPVENLETVVEEGHFHNGVSKEQVFFKRPELHLFSIAKADAVGFQNRVFAEIIILGRKVHNRAHLAVDGAEISLGIRLSRPGIPIFEQLVLPLDNVLRADFSYLMLAEIREDLCIPTCKSSGFSE